MAGERAKGGKKNRKHGRQKKSPAMLRYRESQRWGLNKQRRVEKEKRRQSACKAVRSLACDEGPKLHDVSRRVRIARRVA